MITDLFSHKIHSSGREWPDKLVELAFLFSEFEGQAYNRAAIEARLQRISPRSSFAPRDPAKFRDEISAYPAYLGLFRYELEGGQWIIRLSETTKTLLCREEPDVAAFLRVQLALFQYPNGMGAAFKPGTDKIRLQANARNRTLALIRSGCHVSPLRLITNALLADARLRGCDLFDTSISYREIYALANEGEVIHHASPPLDLLRDALKRYRTGRLRAPRRFERRFHILSHTDLFNVHRDGLAFRKPANSLDRRDLEDKIGALAALTVSFTAFDLAEDGTALADVIKSGAWFRYFDGLATLPGTIVEVLARDAVLDSSVVPQGPTVPPPEEEHAPPVAAIQYPLVARQIRADPSPRISKAREFADPEVTRVKRQRQSLRHKELVDAIDVMLRQLGAEPKQSAHIDLYADIPSDGSILFEMKSGGISLLDQVRKGLAQLYEYRFRYSDVIRPDSHLCLVLGHPPKELPWVLDLLDTLGIALCWMDKNEQIVYPHRCADVLGVLPAHPPES